MLWPTRAARQIGGPRESGASVGPDRLLSMRRLIDYYLERWKIDPRRKPLLVRSARQVGIGDAGCKEVCPYPLYAVAIFLLDPEDPTLEALVDDSEWE